MSKPCFFRDNEQTLMGVHYVAGSHKRSHKNHLVEIDKIINTY